MSGKGTLGSRSIICRDAESWKKAHSIVLHNSALVSPYIDQHENILRLKNPEQFEVFIKKEHMRTFSGWLQNHLTGNKTIEEELYLLSGTPSLTIMSFKGYEINGNTFYTIAQDEKSTNQNSGVRFDDAINNKKKVTYYGYIEEIWELDYGPDFNVPVQMVQYERGKGRPTVRNDNSGCQKSWVQRG